VAFGRAAANQATRIGCDFGLVNLVTFQTK
jgi:hypothetical protein